MSNTIPWRVLRVCSVLAFVSVIALWVTGCGTSASAKVYHIGLVSGIDSFNSIADGFKSKMTELGYVEGKNVEYDFQKGSSDQAKLKEITEGFVKDKMDLIVAFPTQAVVAAKTATQGTTIPVLFAAATVEGTTLIASVAEPGGNITGVRYPGPERAVKRLDILQKLAPAAKRIGIFYNPEYAAAKPAREKLLEAAPSMQVTLIDVPVKTLDALRADLDARVKGSDIGFDALLMMPDDLSQSPQGWEMVKQFAADHKLAIGGNTAAHAEAGAVFSYIPDNAAMGEQAAPLAVKILTGTQAGKIPVVSSENWLIINYKATQDLGLVVPAGLLKLANKIIR